MATSLFYTGKPPVDMPIEEVARAMVSPEAVAFKRFYEQNREVRPWDLKEDSEEFLRDAPKPLSIDEMPEQPLDECQ